MLLPALLLYKIVDMDGGGPQVVGEQRTEVEVLSIKTSTLESGGGRYGGPRTSVRHTHARVRLTDGGEAVVMLNGMPAPAVGGTLDVLVTEYEDGSRRVNPVRY